MKLIVNIIIALVFWGSVGLKGEAQSIGIVTGKVQEYKTERGVYVIQLDVSNACGTTKYVTSTNEAYAYVEGALEQLRLFLDEGVMTLKVSGCKSGAAIIIGAAGGPDIR